MIAASTKTVRYSMPDAGLDAERALRILVALGDISRADARRVRVEVTETNGMTAERGRIVLDGKVVIDLDNKSEPRLRSASQEVAPGRYKLVRDVQNPHWDARMRGDGIIRAGTHVRVQHSKRRTARDEEIRRPVSFYIDTEVGAMSHDLADAIAMVGLVRRADTTAIVDEATFGEGEESYDRTYRSIVEKLFERGAVSGATLASLHREIEAEDEARYEAERDGGLQS